MSEPGRDRRAVHRVSVQTTGAPSTFNVLWAGGELASRRDRDIVMRAASMLRRLGTDVRIRMTTVPPSDTDHWAHTVLVVDDGSRAPAGLLAELNAAARVGPHVMLCLTGSQTPSEEALSASRVELVALNSPDGALLASAWLRLAERVGDAGDGQDGQVREASPAHS